MCHFAREFNVNSRGVLLVWLSSELTYQAEGKRKLAGVCTDKAHSASLHCAYSLDARNSLRVRKKFDSWSLIHVCAYVKFCEHFRAGARTHPFVPAIPRPSSFLFHRLHWTHTIGRVTATLVFSFSGHCWPRPDAKRQVAMLLLLKCTHIARRMRFAPTGRWCCDSDIAARRALVFACLCEPSTQQKWTGGAVACKPRSFTSEMHDVGCPKNSTYVSSKGIATFLEYILLSGAFFCLRALLHMFVFSPLLQMFARAD